MNLIAQYQAWLDEELRQRNRDDPGDFTIPGLRLAQYQLAMLVESRPAVAADFCGVVTMNETQHTVCWQPVDHEGPHA